MKLELKATPEEVMRGVNALQEYAAAQGLCERDTFGLALALEECASNIVNHALRRDDTRTFLLFFERTPELFVLELRDTGAPFDPTAAPSRNPQAEDSDEPGGWGIHLVRHYIDEIRYEREAGENILRLLKRLPSAAIGNHISKAQNKQTN